jgi:hypothetical protein
MIAFNRGTVQADTSIKWPQRKAAGISNGSQLSLERNTANGPFFRKCPAQRVTGMRIASVPVAFKRP